MDQKENGSHGVKEHSTYLAEDIEDLLLLPPVLLVLGRGLEVLILILIITILLGLMGMGS
jgi:hypothetical protein